jgi:hypothetical protein
MLQTRSSRLLAAVLALAAIACDGPRTKAIYPNIARTYALFALSGAPVSAPTAISVLGGSTIADANFGFDLAFDMDAAGATRLYPVRSLAGGLAGVPKRIGLQLVPGSFESLREAPTTGYDTLGFKTVVPGSVVAIEILDIQTCLYSLNGSNIYAKLVVDSIRVPERRIFGRTVSDANCGFREVMPDTIPER